MADILRPVDWIREDCKEFWNKAIEIVGPEFETYLKSFLSEFPSVLRSSTNFTIRVVVDTNVAISEIHRIIRGKKPFLSSLIKSPFLDAIAPIEMWDELDEKIPKVFHEREEQIEARNLAKQIIEDVHLVEGYKVHDRIKAEALMGQRDPKDVVFVQIAFEYESHGVISKDRAFENLEGVKRWDLGEVGRVLTEINRGALTLWIAAIGLPSVAIIMTMIGMSLVSTGFDLVNRFVSTSRELAAEIVSSLSDAIGENPLLTIAIAGVTVLTSFILLSWEPTRKGINDLAQSGMRTVEFFVTWLRGVIEKLFGAIQVLVQAAKDQIPSIIDWFECLMSSTALFFKRINELERVRT